MKRILSAILVIFLLVGCAPGENTIQTAIAQTETHNSKLTATIKSTIRPSKTLKPTTTLIPTLTPRPTNTPLPTKSSDELAKILVDGAEVLIMTMLEDDVESINTIRLNEDKLEIELKTKWASRDRQPDISYMTIQYLSTFTGSWDRDENLLKPILPDGFNVMLVTYSTDGDYRYESYTDFQTLVKVNERVITYDEWVDAANAGFR